MAPVIKAATPDQYDKWVPVILGWYVCHMRSSLRNRDPQCNKITYDVIHRRFTNHLNSHIFAFCSSVAAVYCREGLHKLSV